MEGVILGKVSGVWKWSTEHSVTEHRGREQGKRWRGELSRCLVSSVHAGSQLVGRHTLQRNDLKTEERKKITDFVDTKKSSQSGLEHRGRTGPSSVEGLASPER